MSKQNLKNKENTDEPSFQKNFAILEKTVARLQSHETINIDELLPLVQQAKQAYTMCQQRLQVIDEALQNLLDENPKNHNNKGASNDENDKKK